ncbi:MAG: ABC transporter ATP-binding protein [Pyrobaculum sp.]
MALVVEKLESGYGKLKILFGVSLKVDKGVITALLGPNGSGKTTTLLTIMGVVKPWSGFVKFGEVDVTNLPPYKKVDLGMALVPEGRRLFPDMSVEENLLMGAYVKRARDKTRDSLEWVYSLFPRLRERRGQKAKTLSGGEQQMLAIGRALMSRPRLLMIDEPSAGLAPKVVADLFDTLKKISGEVSILLVEQNVAAALEISQYAYVLENGRIVMEGLGEELAKSDYIKKTYLGL